MKRLIYIVCFLTLLFSCEKQQPATSGTLADENSYVSFSPIKNGFSIFENKTVTTLIVSKEDFSGVQKVAKHLQRDIQAVTSSLPALEHNIPKGTKQAILIGTLDNSPIIQQLIDSGKLNVSTLEGKWEKHLITTIENPFDGMEKALVIVGSDKRGTIYGMYDLSEEIGVSPWHYWADVPIVKQETVFIKPGSFTKGEPKVKYRGIFINDEAPALRNWAQETFGGFNHQFYEKVYELILRNKGNYLWPAMWRPAAFADDDPENARLADEYGIVISTSHHEPMMRAHDEWSRYGEGPWNYNTNKEKLQEFWREGMQRMSNYESVVTLGMRGDGDEAMSENTAVELLKQIIADQRNIITEVTQKPIEETPQVWALYKEVQDYYDKGMRVDDDIMLLFCDDNWGNVRILPKKEDFNYKGGFGMYYHFDFVGGPVSYRWLNVTQIERVWEQMNLTYQWGVKDLWLVNVGDIKPMEFPISFFLDFAWNAEDIKASDLPNYYTNWAKKQFGSKHAKEIGEIIALYTKYNARRTPEMLKPDTYNLENYREADRIVEEYKDLVARSSAIYSQLDDNYKSAFYQLVLSPVELCSNLNEMYVAAGKNELYANQGRASTNFYADKAKGHFLKDSVLTEKYHQLNNGKWKHMMSQTHIGYTSWNNPPKNIMPSVVYNMPKAETEMGYFIEHESEANSFSTYDPINNQSFYLEVFNKGKEDLIYVLKAEQDWIQLSSNGGTIAYEEKVEVNIDWKKAPKGRQTGQLLLSSKNQHYSILIPINNITTQTKGFIENNGVVSIVAAHFSNKKESKDIKWVVVPNMGRTASAITIEPANADTQLLGNTTPYLEYEFTTFKEGDLKIETYLSPTLNYKKNEGLKFAISVDDETPQIINIHEGETTPDWEYPEWWNVSVTDHIKKKTSEHSSIKSGIHTLKIWLIDAGVVFQKYVINNGGLKPSYLGPPESKNIEK